MLNGRPCFGQGFGNNSGNIGPRVAPARWPGPAEHLLRRPAGSPAIGAIMGALRPYDREMVLDTARALVSLLRVVAFTLEDRQSAEASSGKASSGIPTKDWEHRSGQLKRRMSVLLEGGDIWSLGCPATEVGELGRLWSASVRTPETFDDAEACYSLVRLIEESLSFLDNDVSADRLLYDAGSIFQRDHKTGLPKEFARLVAGEMTVFFEALLKHGAQDGAELRRDFAIKAPAEMLRRILKIEPGMARHIWGPRDESNPNRGKYYTNVVYVGARVLPHARWEGPKADSAQKPAKTAKAKVPGVTQNGGKRQASRKKSAN